MQTGRPRDAHIDAAVLDAALAMLDGDGYGGLSIERVARLAGTTKPAVYRRWPGRPQLATAALASRLGVVAAPDTGCTLCDLNEGLGVFVAAFRRIRPDVLGPLLADCAADPALHAALLETLFEPPRRAVASMLERAVARGDLRADLDTGLVLDMLGSLVHYRVLFGHAPIGPAEIERAVESLLRGLATDYDALVAHSRRVAGHPHAAADAVSR